MVFRQSEEIKRDFEMIKTTSITLMKICVSALIMHLPIKEIASRAKNVSVRTILK